VTLLTDAIEAGPQPVFAGALAAIVGFASTFALILAALTASGASAGQAASGLLALCLAVGLLNILACLRLRIPASFAWSTPGAAFLLTSAAGDFNATVGAFLVTALLIAISGAVQPLARLIAMIPGPIANAMLAGMLLTLCLAPFEALSAEPLLTLPILVAWGVMLKLAPRFAVPVAVVVTGLVLAFTISLPPGALANSWPSLSFVLPRFDPLVIVSIALPLFIVTMASQNLPGLAVMRANGYELPAGPAFLSSGMASGVAALFGGLTVNLAAITAAITAGPEAHPDPAKRWLAPLVAGICYIGLGCAAGAAAALVSAAPPVLIEAVAGLALLTSLGAALSAALASPDMRLPALVTLAATASGISLFGVGAPFWGLVGGLLLHALLRKPAQPLAAP
jgi:benzoate membrane transport protein